MADQSASPFVVEARNLGRRYGRREVLSGINLQIRRGEIFGILAPDGAGKTTLLQLFAAILDPSSGNCQSLGFDTVAEAPRVVSRIGYMSQGFTLYDRLSVDENLRFAAQIRGVTGEVWQARRRRLLAMAGLARFGSRRADQLSGGMRKQLALCANLIHEPPLLLLDEPGLGVDPLSRRELWEILRHFRHGGATIVVTTSYMDEAASCDRLAFLDRGRMLVEGTPTELEARSGNLVYEIVAKSPEQVEEMLGQRPGVVAIQRFRAACAYSSIARPRLNAEVERVRRGSNGSALARGRLRCSIAGPEARVRSSAAPAGPDRGSRPGH